MFFANARIRSVAAAVLMLFTATACASNDSVAKIKTPQDIKKIVQKKSRYTPEEREVEQRRRMGVIERANLPCSAAKWHCKRAMRVRRWLPIW